MAKLTKRIGILIGATFNELFDKATEGMTIPMLKQHIREMEEALSTGRTKHAEAIGALEIARQDLARLEGEVAATIENIELILSDDDPSNDHFADRLGVKLTEQEANLPRAAERVETQELIVSQLEQAVGLIQERMIEARQQVRTLEAEAEQAEAMNQAADALEEVTGALDTGVGAGIDSLAEKTRLKSAAARARLQQHTASADPTASAERAIASSRAKSRVDEIRARLAAQKAEAEAAAS